MTLVAGIDSSTQACKVVVRDAVSGTLVRSGRAAHPDGTEVHPRAWQRALDDAVQQAGGLDDVGAVAVAAQQHGMVALDDAGDVVRPALLWNDVRSAGAAADLVSELGGAAEWATAVDVVPVASFTISKLRWMAEAEPSSAARTTAVCLPHDWLTWRLSGSRQMEDLRTDRSDASGTGYWSAHGGYRRDLLVRALGHDAHVPAVLGPAETAGQTPGGALLAAGAGDNAAAAIGLGATAGDIVVSIGTSGVACAVSEQRVSDPTGTVAGFADATGRFLPLVATLNGAQVLDATARLLGVGHDDLSRLALAAPAGAEGLVLVPYLQGERTPNRPDASGTLHGMTLRNTTPAHLARAAVEGLLCGIADAVDAVVAQGVPVSRVLLVGGAARSEAVRRVAASVLGCTIVVPAPSEYVADGAARQAAWALSGLPSPPDWPLTAVATLAGDPVPHIRTRYADARDHTLRRLG